MDRQGSGPADQEPVALGRAPIVGRDRELAELDRLIDCLTAHQPRVLILSGEAGIGKSRLLAELIRRARARGVRVASGQCLDETGMPPFVPWVGALRTLRDIPAIEQASAALIGAVDSVAASPERRLWTFDSLTRALVDLAAVTPLLLVFDDVQWSDPSSNQLLRYVTANLDDVPVAVAVAYRPEESDANPELGRTLAGWDRRRISTELALEPLTNTQSAALLATLVTTPDPTFAEQIAQVAGGNPLLIEEMVRAASHDVHPRAIRRFAAIVARRLDALSPPSRETIQLAALGGREVDAGMLAQALARPLARIAEELDEAVLRALLVSDDGDEFRYRFTHDRVREAVAAQTPAALRRSLHEHLLDLFDRSDGSDDLTTLAAALHHAERAGRTDRGAAIATRLAAAAFRANAFDESARAAETALRLGPTTAALLIQLANARLAAGLPGVLDTYRAAGSVARAAGDPHLSALALYRLGVAHGRREEFDAALDAFEAATAIIDQQDPPTDPALLAEILIDRCQILGLSLGRYPEALAAGRRALSLISELPDDPTLGSRVRQALAATSMRSGALEEGRRLLEPALSLGVRANRPDLAAEAAGMLANHAYWVADLDASERYARRRRELAVAAGDPFARRHALPWLAILANARGNFDEARTLIDRARQDLRSVDSPEPHAFVDELDGMTELHAGSPVAAAEKLERAVAGFRHSGPATLTWYLGMLGLAYIAVDRSDLTTSIATELESLIAGLPASALPRGAALGQLGLIYIALADRAAQRRTLTALAPFAGQHHWVLMDRVRGELAAALGDSSLAETAFATAAQTALRGGLRPELALTQAARAKLRLATGNRAAADELTAAVARLRELGMSRYANQFATPTTSDRPLPAGLSVREVSVLVLVARGMTNRQIGDELGISEKTVTNHLTHIFTKCDVDNRAAAVAFALRHQLA